MTMLEKLMQDGVTRGLVGSFSRFADSAGEQLGKELWSDPEFRTQMQTLIRRFGQQVVEQMTAATPEDELRETMRAMQARLEAIEALLRNGHHNL
jgi:hypothetical protein